MAHDLTWQIARINGNDDGSASVELVTVDQFDPTGQDRPREEWPAGPDGEPLWLPNGQGSARILVADPADLVVGALLGGMLDLDAPLGDHRTDATARLEADRAQAAVRAARSDLQTQGVPTRMTMGADAMVVDGAQVSREQAAQAAQSAAGQADTAQGPSGAQDGQR